MVIYGTPSFKMRLLTFVLNALWEEACRSENGNSFNTLGSEYVNRILKLQKRTARLILYQIPIAPFGHLFKQLGWMTIEQRIKYHKYLLVSKYLRLKHLYIQKINYNTCLTEIHTLSEMFKWKIANPKVKNWSL
jgi:hypothetical protein